MPRSPAGARRRAVRHSHRQAADRSVAAGDPAARAAMGDDRVGRDDDGGAGCGDRDAVRLEHMDRILAEGRAAAAMAHGARRRIAVRDGVVGILRRAPHRTCRWMSPGRCRAWRPRWRSPQWYGPIGSAAIRRCRWRSSSPRPFSSRPIFSITTWWCSASWSRCCATAPTIRRPTIGCLIAVWTLPVTMMIAAVVWIPLAPIVLIAFAGRLVWRLAQIDSRDVRPLPDKAAAAVA